MMKNVFVMIFVAIGIISGSGGIPSCERLLNTAVTITQEDGQSQTPLSSSEIVEGLKTALKIGTDSSVAITSRLDGFYKDQAIKILLPPEAAVIYDNKDNALVKAIGLDKKIEDAILAINRAAEDAAKEAGPIFMEAITEMSITDGLSILKGQNPANPSASASFDSTAATAYLRFTTGEQLRNAFSPRVNASLNKKLVGNFSPNELWNTLSASYNEVARRSFGMVEPMENTDLGAYVTEKTLDGIFLKVALEEKKIRKDPLDWAKTSAGNILRRVFGEKQF